MLAKLPSTQTHRLSIRVHVTGGKLAKRAEGCLNNKDQMESGFGWLGTQTPSFCLCVGKETVSRKEGMPVADK